MSVYRKLQTYGRAHLRAMLWLAVVSNLLVLAPSLHMLQVYNRVLSSYSLETLFYLTLIVVVLLACYGAVETLRARVAHRLASAYAVSVSQSLFQGFADPERGASRTGQDLRDFQTVRGYIASRAFVTLFDAPFVPFFILILFMAHWTVGVLTLIGAGVLAGIGAASMKASNRSQMALRMAEGEAHAVADSALARSEDVRSLGLLANLETWWRQKTAHALVVSDAAAAEGARYYAISRAVRQIIQVLLMALAAWLVIAGQMSAAMIFLANMVAGKALGPIEQIIGGWEGLAKARASFESLEGRMEEVEAAPERMDLPEPTGHIQVENLVVEGADPAKPVVAGASFEVRPGELVAIVGISGAGKSVLARAIAGAIPATSGAIRLDGAELGQWPPERWGRAIGYVAQETNLFPGTVAANIARFEQGVTGAPVYAAGQRAGAHETILAMPKGYMTPITEGASMLSSGQRKAIALARAFYGEPKALILDQPTTHLDQLAEERLIVGLADAKKRGMALIVISQRATILNLADRAYAMREGTLHPLPRRDAAPAGAQGEGESGPPRRRVVMRPVGQGADGAAQTVPESA